MAKVTDKQRRQTMETAERLNLCFDAMRAASERQLACIPGSFPPLEMLARPTVIAVTFALGVAVGWWL